MTTAQCPEEDIQQEPDEVDLADFMQALYAGLIQARI